VPSIDTYILVVGKPVANCQQGNTQKVTTKFVSEMDIQETWSVDSTVGIDVGGLKVDTTVGWSHATTVKASQEVQLDVVPGQMVRPTHKLFCFLKTRFVNLGCLGR
jgi:hypothetical protein